MKQADCEESEPNRDPFKEVDDNLRESDPVYPFGYWGDAILAVGEAVIAYSFASDGDAAGPMKKQRQSTSRKPANSSNKVRMLEN